MIVKLTEIVFWDTSKEFTIYVTPHGIGRFFDSYCGNRDATAIHFTDGCSSYVKETPEQIYEWLTGGIQLTEGM